MEFNTQLNKGQKVFFIGKNNEYHEATFIKRKGIYFVLLFENKEILRMNGDIFVTELEALEWCYSKEKKIRHRLEFALNESARRAAKYFDRMIDIHLRVINDNNQF